MAWMAAAIPFIQAAGAAVAVGSAVMGAQASRNAGRYQAAVARNNAIIADQHAQAEVQKGQRQEEAKRIETAQRMGAVRASAAASGLDVNTGTALLLQEDTALIGELDALTIRNNSERNARGYRIQGMSYSSQAEANDAQASNSMMSGYMNATGSLVGYASQVAERWKGMKTSGSGYGTIDPTQAGAPGPW